MNDDLSPLPRRRLAPTTLRRASAAFCAVVCLAAVGCQNRAIFPTVGMARAMLAESIAQPSPFRIYRQYVKGNEYLQFERAEGAVLYGYRACSEGCAFSRVPFVAVYDGSHLLMAYGRHEDLYATSAEGSDLLVNRTTNPRTNGVLSALWRFSPEGRNLAPDASFYGCLKDTEAFQWRRHMPDVDDAGNPVCTPLHAVAGLWVATTDDVLVDGAAGIAQVGAHRVVGSSSSTPSSRGGGGGSPPDDTLRPGGSGWFCWASSRGTSSCVRSEEECQRTLEGESLGGHEAGPCVRRDRASCHGRSAPSVGMVPYAACFATSADCGASAREVAIDGFDVSSCAVWD